MPAIRDYTFAFEALTTDGGITIPMCNYQLNDLLLVLVMGDTGAGTWGAAGYTQLFARNNTCSFVCLYKIATASEGDVVVTNTVLETYNGCVIAIRDVNTTNPFGATPIQTNVAQAAAARFAMPTVTTTVANAMLIFVSANSGTGVPSLIEGPVFGLLGADGSAESLGIGWAMQRATGLSNASIFCSNIATGAGVAATIQIAPPSGGAGVIPAYCASDSSSLLEFVNGVTGYNGNTGMAATADTNFGTTLGGRTANDAVVAASTDVGINSFHSFARLTNAAVAGTVSGAELVFAVANRPNVTGKNILTHVRPQSPGQYQALAPVSSGRGVWFGLRSAAANYKIWQVHGVGTKWALDGKVPVVVNESAVNTKATAGTLVPSAVQALGFWNSSIGILTNGMEFGMAWMMDACTVCGGNAAEPIGVDGIFQSAAKGHERLSSVLQGSGQMLCLQAIQIGDGGTNGTFLDLDATAIEFPSQYNSAVGDVNYNSVDNLIGLTYYAGSTDTIKHRNSVVSSKSKYHWRIHASSSASASYDFAGLSIIGAGDVQLRQVATFADMAFVDCPTITQNSAVVSGSRFTRSKVTSNAPNSISTCAFTGSTGTGHAIEITTAGTYTFAGNTFTGYGTAGSTDAAIYNNSGGAVTLNVTSGGSTPTIRNGAGASTTVNNNVSVTLTGLKNPTEIRVFNAGTTTERSGTGAENVTSGSHTFAMPSGTSVDIAILSLGFQNLRVLAYSSTVDVPSLPISQVLDRQFLNP